ncbi:DUF4238 domain-containing protein [Paraglaciecola arctica]|uniref:DUF4238 domain-containing protein n=1 Tax=Paraglaciecola arctica TaxID=1128911 RepID=UPI001C07DD25|nr:DUF4238 domain-containing protein [Paraglaciecola arctica]
MGRKAKHHYIPKCYLKGFTDGGEYSSSFWCIPINNDTPFKTSPNDSCATRDYYSVEHIDSLIVENFYAEQIEPKISAAIRAIEEHKSLPTKQGMHNLILLLATLYLRVPSFRSTLEAPRKRTKEIIDSISEDVPISNRSEFEYSQTDLIMTELDLISTVQECLANKYYQLYIIEESDQNVITSDRPFLLSHPKAGKGFYFGLNTPNVEITVPITKRAVLLARNEPFHEGSYIASKEFIGLTNTKLILSANRFFYSNAEEIMLVDNDISVYKHKISTNKSMRPTVNASAD